MPRETGLLPALFERDPEQIPAHHDFAERIVLLVLTGLDIVVDRSCPLAARAPSARKDVPLVDRLTRKLVPNTGIIS